MDIRQLRYFVTIADCGSLSQASLKLHVVQSALSHNISQLEEELGTNLFNRQPRGVQVTPAGERLYEYARNILDTIDEATQEISSIGEEKNVNVWIGLNHTGNRLTLPHLPRFLGDEFPQIKFGFMEDLSQTLVEYLLDKKVDLAITYNPPEELSFATIPILEEAVYCVGAAPAIGDTSLPISFEELCTHPLVLAGQGTNMRGIVKKLEHHKKLEKASTMEINSLSVLIPVLKDGQGLSILSESTIKQELDNGELFLRPIVEPEIKRTLHIVYNDKSKNKALLEQVALKIKSLIHETIAKSDYRSLQLLNPMPKA